MNRGLEFESRKIKTKKEKKWVKSGQNPEGTQMYRQVTITVPVLRTGETPPPPPNFDTPGYVQDKLPEPKPIQKREP